MEVHKVIVISERLELRCLLMKHLGAEYEVLKYRYVEWCENDYMNLAVIDRGVVLIIIEAQGSYIENMNLVRRIRLCSFNEILLFISKTEERDEQIKEKICAINAGVDIYLRYPQTNEEILASVKALLRRLHWKGDCTLKIRSKQLQINPQTRKVFMDGIELVFTKIEFAIFNYLILHLNRAVSYKELYEAVWGKEYLYDDRNIMAHIHRMRKKMGDDTKNPRYIQNVYGTGYMVEGE